MGFARFKKRITRKLTVFKLMKAKNGIDRARILKKNDVLGGMGDNCWYEPHRIPAESKLVFFGNNVNIATEVLFMNHDLTSHMLNKINGENKYKIRKGEIHIGNNVFIGAGSIILYDVTIGNNVIVGAGSIITKDIPDNSVVAGVPAKFIKTFDEYVEKMDQLNSQS